jgi:serine protease
MFNLNPPDVNGPIVGLIDTSVDPPDQFQKYTLTPVSVVGTPDAPTDQPSHGTAMLETMLGSMAADPSMVQPVIVYSEDQSTTTYDLMNGIIKAINMGDNPISISSGGTGDSSMFGDLIAEATQKGIQFVAAAGNVPGTEDTYPAAYPGVLAVTASGPNGQLAPYADDGTFVDAIEPGTAMIVWNGEEWVVEGTSPATAAMAGSIALTENQNRVNAQQAAALQAQSHPPPKP